jgi:serine/threonine protein kinase
VCRLINPENVFLPISLNGPTKVFLPCLFVLIMQTDKRKWSGQRILRLFLTLGLPYIYIYCIFIICDRKFYAPELLHKREPHSQSSDIYSLGACLKYLITRNNSGAETNYSTSLRTLVSTIVNLVYDFFFYSTEHNHMRIFSISQEPSCRPLLKDILENSLLRTYTIKARRGKNALDIDRCLCWW